MRVRWTRPALRDLRALQDYIAEDSPTTANRITRRIRDAVSGLADFPESSRPGRVGKTRELIVNKGRHLVAYRVRGQIVQIIALVDVRRGGVLNIISERTGESVSPPPHE